MELGQLGSAGDPSRCVSICITRQGSLNRSTVHDLRDANTGIESRTVLWNQASTHSQSQSALATDQDASWANAAEDHSQGAFLVGAFSPELWNNAPSPFALLSRSCPRPWQRSSGFVGFSKS